MSNIFGSFALGAAQGAAQGMVQNAVNQQKSEMEAAKEKLRQDREEFLMKIAHGHAEKMQANSQEFQTDLQDNSQKHAILMHDLTSIDNSATQEIGHINAMELQGAGQDFQTVEREKDRIAGKFGTEAKANSEMRQSTVAALRSNEVELKAAITQLGQMQPNDKAGREAVMSDIARLKNEARQLRGTLSSNGQTNLNDTPTPSKPFNPADFMPKAPATAAPAPAPTPAKKAIMSMMEDGGSSTQAEAVDDANSRVSYSMFSNDELESLMNIKGDKRAAQELQRRKLANAGKVTSVNPAVGR